jgi:hypothetical protein
MNHRMLTNNKNFLNTPKSDFVGPSKIIRNIFQTYSENISNIFRTYFKYIQKYSKIFENTRNTFELYIRDESEPLSQINLRRFAIYFPPINLRHFTIYFLSINLRHFHK